MVTQKEKTAGGENAWMTREIALPEGVKASMEGYTFTMSGKMGTSKRIFDSPYAIVSISGNKVTVKNQKDNRRGKRVFETYAAHLMNMIKGVTKGFRYELQVVQGHFPTKVNVKGNQILIENFLGEKTPRVVIASPGVKARTADGKVVFIEGADIEDVSHVAQAMETKTKIKSKDRRVFQDGVYLVGRGTMEA